MLWKWVASENFKIETRFWAKRLYLFAGLVAGSTYG